MTEYRAIRGYCPASRWDAGSISVYAALQWAAALWEVGHPRSAIRREMKRWGLSSVSRQAVGTLSQGYQRRVLLAMSLLMTPTVWIVDRPFEALDGQWRVQVQTLLTLVLSRPNDIGVPKIVILGDATPEDLPAAMRMSVVPGSALTIGHLER